MNRQQDLDRFELGFRPAAWLRRENTACLEVLLLAWHRSMAHRELVALIEKCREQGFRHDTSFFDRAVFESHVRTFLREGFSPEDAVAFADLKTTPDEYLFDVLMTSSDDSVA